MPIIVHCACGQTMQAPDHAVGKQVRCPKCHAAVVVAAPPAQRPAAPPNNSPDKPSGELRKPAVAKPAAPKPAASAPPVPAPAKRGKRRTWMILGCVGLILLGCLSGVGFGGYYLYANIVGAFTVTQAEVHAHVAKGPGILQDANVKAVDTKFPDADTKAPDAKAPDDPSKDGAKSPSGKGPRPGEPFTLTAHLYNRVLALRMNAKGVVVTAAADDQLKVWDPVSWTVKKQKSPGRVILLDVTAHGSTAVFFTSKVVNGLATDLKIWRWDWDKDAEPKVIATPKHTPDQLAIAPDGKSAVWDDDYRLVIWDLEKNSERTSVAGMFRSQVRGLAMNADATEVITVQDDLSEWFKLKPQQSRERFKVPGEPHCAAFVTPTTLLMGTFAKKALVWDLTKKQATKEMPLPGPARQAVVSADGKRIAIAAFKGVVIFDSADVTKPLGTVTMPPEFFADRVALDGPGRLMVTSGNEPDGKCLVWDISQLK